MTIYVLQIYTCDSHSDPVYDFENSFVDMNAGYFDNKEDALFVARKRVEDSGLDGPIQYIHNEISCGFQVVCDNDDAFSCLVIPLDPNNGYRKVVYS